VGALCGNVRYVTEKIWLTDNAFRVVDYQFEFDYTFLTYLLNYKNLRSFARQAAQPVISNASLKEVVLRFPNSRFEQRTIAIRFDILNAEVRRLQDVYKKKHEDLEMLKKAILQRALVDELNTEKVHTL
jgi:type I restriction enzyme S subunit